MMDAEDDGKFSDSDSECTPENYEGGNETKERMRLGKRATAHKGWAVSSGNSALIVDFGRAVTCTSSSKECWVARKGRESIFNAFMLTLQQV
jgi:hypothetical protein